MNILKVNLAILFLMGFIFPTDFILAQETRSLLEPINRAREVRQQVEEGFQFRTLQLEENKGARLQDRIRENQEMRKSFITEARIKIDSGRRNAISKIVENSNVIIDRVILNLENHKNRITERIKTLQEKGVNTEESQKLLDVANANLELSKTEIEKIKTELRNILNQDEVNPSEIRIIMQEARIILLETKNSFVEVLKSLKISLEEINNIEEI
jgi:hypothetical protein